MLSDLVSQRRGDDGLAHDGVLGHRALLNAARADVVEQQNADLVAGEQLIAAVLALDGDADAVRVGVGGQHQVSAGLLGQLQTQAQRLEDLGVGIRAGREVAVRVLLLGHNGDVGDADVAQNMGDGHKAGAVQRAVDELQTGGLADARADGACLNGGIQRVDAVVTDVLDQALGHAVLKGDQLGAGQDIGFLNFGVDDVGGLVGHLAAVRAVGLVAVVLGGVVAGRDHDTGVAVVIAGRKAQRGHGHKGAVDADLDAVGGQHLGSGPGEQVALDAAVIADGNGLAAALGLDPVGKALGRLTDNVNIHTVGACTDDAAQARCTELQGHSKTVLNGGIVTLDAFQLGLEVSVVQLCSEPTLIHILIHK